MVTENQSNSDNDREACRINSKLKTDDDYTSYYTSMRDTFVFEPKDNCITPKNGPHAQVFRASSQMSILEQDQSEEPLPFIVQNMRLKPASQLENYD